MSERGHRINRRSLIIILCLSLASLHVLRAYSDWKSIAPGMDYKYVAAKTPSAVGDSRIFILRIDSNLWQLEAIGISQTGESAGHTARDWSPRHKFHAASHVGMLATDCKPPLRYN